MSRFERTRGHVVEVFFFFFWCGEGVTFRKIMNGPTASHPTALILSISMSSKGVLYHSPRSRSTRVMWLLEELGDKVWQDHLSIKVCHVCCISPWMAINGGGVDSACE
jgi:hypothetical protein